MKNNESGAVLILVLSVLTVLITLAANFSVTIGRGISIAESLSAGVQAKYSANSGVQYAMYAMRELDEELRWEKDGVVYQVEMDTGTVYVSVASEAGRIDINLASYSLLRDMFIYTGVTEEMSEQIARNIMYWRGKNKVARNDDIDDDDDYESAGLELPGHRYFYTKEEIAQVMRITPGMYSRIKGLITTYGGKKVSALTASHSVLRAIGMEPDEIAELEQARADYYANEVSIPSSVTSINPHLSRSINNRYYRIVAYSKLESGHSSTAYSIISLKKEKSGQFREVESGLIFGDERSEFLKQVNIAKQQAEAAEK